MRIRYKQNSYKINFKSRLAMATLFYANFLIDISLLFFWLYFLAFQTMHIPLKIYDNYLRSWPFEETKVTQGRRDQETFKNNNIPSISERYIKGLSLKKIGMTLICIVTPLKSCLNKFSIYNQFFLSIVLALLSISFVVVWKMSLNNWHCLQN